MPAPGIGSLTANLRDLTAPSSAASSSRGSFDAGSFQSALSSDFNVSFGGASLGSPALKALVLGLAGYGFYRLLKTL